MVSEIFVLWLLGLVLAFVVVLVALFLGRELMLKATRQGLTVQTQATEERRQE